MAVVLEDVNLALPMKVRCNGASAGRCQTRAINESPVHTVSKGVNFALFMKAMSRWWCRKVSASHRHWKLSAKPPWDDYRMSAPASAISNSWLKVEAWLLEVILPPKAHTIRSVSSSKKANGFSSWGRKTSWFRSEGPSQFRSEGQSQLRWEGRSQFN